MVATSVSEQGSVAKSSISKPTIPWTSIPETVWGWLEIQLRESVALLPKAEGKARARLMVTIREIESVLDEVRDPRDIHRPIYPRVIRIVVRMIEDGLL